jgi:hypothetical protein
MKEDAQGFHSLRFQSCAHSSGGGGHLHRSESAEGCGDRMDCTSMQAPEAPTAAASTDDGDDDALGDDDDEYDLQRYSSPGSPPSDAQLNNGTLLLVCNPRAMRLVFSKLRNSAACSAR